MTPEGRIGPGRLIAVVGPSGAGKDSIMRAAKSALAGEQVIFPRRVITRAADDHEEHMPVSPAKFHEMEGAGAFAFAWKAHGLSYGISRDIDAMLCAGVTVVLNVSRGIVPLLRGRYAHLTIAAVSVDPRCLEQRLSARRRETPQEITLRLARARQEGLTGPDVVEIDNNGPLQDAVRHLLSVIGRVGPAA